MDIKAVIKDNRKILQGLFLKNKELALIREEFIKYLQKNAALNGSLVIAAAHQPVFYYPGIVFKNHYIHEKAKETGGIAINFIVDTDKAHVSIPVPYKKDGYYYKRMIEMDCDEAVFSEFKPPRENVLGFFRKIDKSIISLDNDQIKKAFDDFKNSFIKDYSQERDFINSIVRLRKEWERSNGWDILDLRLSEITGSFAFYWFAFYIIKRIDHFVPIYNKAVHKNKKGDYQDVKLLKQDGDVYELPFWLVEKSGRYPLFLRKHEDIFSFYSTEEKEIISIDMQNKQESEIIDLLRQKVRLFPKALIFTLMARIFLCDVFIHGTGGSFYDRITNDIIKDFFNLRSFPEYLTITGERYLPLINEDVSEIDNKYREKRRWIKEARHHPLKYMQEDDSDRFLREKKEISSELLQENDPEKRNNIHKRLKDLDIQMKDILKERIGTVEEEIKGYENILKSREALIEREYPYFLYSPILFKTISPDASLCTHRSAS